MNTRQTRNARARKLLGDKRLLVYLRWNRQLGGGPLACRLINEALDGGETLDALFNDPRGSGFFVEARRTGGAGGGSTLATWRAGWPATGCIGK